MTIIASFNAFGTSVLIGDLLLSSKKSPPVEVNIPAARNINDKALLPPNHFIAGLRKKVVLLGKQMVLAWSDRYDQAADLIDTLLPLGMIGQVPADILDRVLSSIEPQRINELSYLLLAITEAGPILRSHRVDGPRQVGLISNVASAGSGRPVFMSNLKQFSGQHLLTNIGNDQVEHLRDGLPHMLVAALMAEEFMSFDNLRAGWGGGYDVVTYERNQFAYSGPTLTLLFSVTEEGGAASLWWHPTFRHNAQWRDLTVVQAIDHGLRGRKITPGRHDIFLLTAPGQEPRDLSDFVPPRLYHSEKVLVSVVLEARDDTLALVSAWNETPFRYAFHQEMMQVSFNPEFIADLTDRISERLRMRCTFTGFRRWPSVTGAR